jgi:hypothetical protein
LTGWRRVEAKFQRLSFPWRNEVLWGFLSSSGGCLVHHRVPHHQTHVYPVTWVSANDTKANLKSYQ